MILGDPGPLHSNPEVVVVKPTRPERPGLQQRLDSWKGIAQYLGRSARTVQRWHSEYGLPIYRLGTSKGSVFAYSNELDEWMMNRGRIAGDLFPEFGAPAVSRVPDFPDELIARKLTLESSLIPEIARTRSADLVALCHKMWERLSHKSLNVIAGYFREAIDLNPGNAEAFAGLSSCLIAEGVLGVVRAPMAYAAAEAALRGALEIDPELPDGKLAEAWLKIVSKREWKSARRCFEDALKMQLPPTRAMVGLAMMCIAEGQPQRASELLDKFTQMYPLSTAGKALYSLSEYMAGEYSHALELVDQVRASIRSGPLVDAVEALALVHLGEMKAQLPRMEHLAAESPHHDALVGAVGYAYALSGEVKRAREILDILTDTRRSKSSREPYAVALVYLGLKEHQNAVEWLDKSYKDGSVWSLGFRSDPVLAPLRNDPYFLQLMGRISYPDPDDSDSRLGMAD